MDREKIQEMEERSKITLEEMVEGRLHGKTDPFWSDLVIKYFKEELKMNDTVAKRIFTDLAKYDDILSEFAKYLSQRTYDMPNAIVVNDYTAKQVHELNPKFEACGVYTFLRLIRDNREEAERIIASSFKNKDTKSQKVDFEGLLKKIDNRIKELENEKELVKCPKCKSEFTVDCSKNLKTEELAIAICPKCKNVFKYKNPLYNKKYAQEVLSQIKESQEYYRKLRESWKVYIKNKFNSQIVQDEKQVEDLKQELSTSKDSLNYICGSTVPNKQGNFEQILVTKNHIYFNLDNEIKVLIDDSAKSEKVINQLKDNLKGIKENSEKEKSIAHTKSSSKCEMHITIDNNNYFLSDLVNDGNLKRFFKYLLMNIKDIVFSDITPMTASDCQEIDKTIDEIYADSITSGDLFWVVSTKQYMRTLKLSREMEYMKSLKLSHETVKRYKDMLLAISKDKDILHEFERCITKLFAGKGEYLDDGDGLVIENMTAKDIHKLTHLPMLCVYEIFAFLKKKPEKTKELLRTKYHFKG